MVKQNFSNWGEFLYWTYASTNMLMAFLANKKQAYDRSCYAVRAKAFKAYKEGRWNIHTLYENNNWKMNWGKDTCWYCNRPISECGELTAEHIFPRAKGGDDSFDNIAYACKSCNSSKGTKDLLVWFVKEKGEYPPFPLICIYLKLVYKYSVEHDLFELHYEDMRKLDLPFDPQALDIVLHFIEEAPNMYKQNEHKEEDTLSTIDALKARLDALRPLPPESLKKIEEAIRIEYTYESNRIEGNTLTLQETQVVVGEGLTIAGKSMREHLEAVNHCEAIDFVKDVVQRKIPITEYLIKQIHAIILQGIDRKNAGRYRTVPVLISGSKHVPPQPYLVEKQMEDFMNEYNKKDEAGEHPIRLAAWLHRELVRIHPFVDGNGRTARLLMNLLLLRAGYVFVVLKGDAASRVRYYTALEKAHVEGNPESFDQLVAEKEKEALTQYLSLFE